MLISYCLTPGLDFFFYIKACKCNVVHGPTHKPELYDIKHGIPCGLEV